jgi:NitT/TauT family transport system ATP-binding protein
MSADVIEFNGVGHAYASGTGGRQHLALQSLSFSLRERERLAVIGPNGSGKTTLLRIALGSLVPTSGQVHRSSLSRDEQSYIPQDYRNALLPWLKIQSNIAIALDRNTAPVFPRLRPATYRRFLRAGGGIPIRFDRRRFPYTLSGGEQQLLTVLLAVLRQPRLLVADEPFSSVDLHRRPALIEFVDRELERLGGSLLFVSHDVDEALFLATSVLILPRDPAGAAANFSVDRPGNATVSEWMRSGGFVASRERIMAALCETR